MRQKICRYKIMHKLQPVALLVYPYAVSAQWALYVTRESLIEA